MNHRTGGTCIPSPKSSALTNNDKTPTNITTATRLITAACFNHHVLSLSSVPRTIRHQRKCLAPEPEAPTGLLVETPKEMIPNLQAVRSRNDLQLMSVQGKMRCGSTDDTHAHVRHWKLPLQLEPGARISIANDTASCHIRIRVLCRTVVEGTLHHCMNSS